MFIRKVRKTDHNSNKNYFYYQLVEAFRTHKGPKQKILLNQGHVFLTILYKTKHKIQQYFFYKCFYLP